MHTQLKSTQDSLMQTKIIGGGVKKLVLLNVSKPDINLLLLQQKWFISLRTYLPAGTWRPQASVQLAPGFV